MKIKLTIKSNWYLKKRKIPIKSQIKNFENLLKLSFTKLKLSGKKTLTTNEQYLTLKTLLQIPLVCVCRLLCIAVFDVSDSVTRGFHTRFNGFYMYCIYARF